jgi:hypothetical protein
LLQDIHKDKKLVASSQWSDPNKLQHGVLKRALPNLVNIASQYVVPEDKLEEKAAEMINAVGIISLNFSKLAT